MEVRVLPRTPDFYPLILLSAYSLCGIIGGMDAKTKERILAIKLRKDGLSYGEIMQQIPVAKSSLSLWLKSVRLKPEHRKRLYTKHIMFLSRGAQSQKERRAREVQDILKKAESEISLPLPRVARQLLGAALYWAEGSKKGVCEVTNSDPYLIAFMVKWFESIFDISPKTLKIRLSIYPQQDESKLKKFWSQITGIPVKNFGKSFVKPPNKGYKKNNLYFGTAQIYVPKSVDNKHKIFGWLAAAFKDIAPHVERVKKRWYLLTQVKRTLSANL